MLAVYESKLDELLEQFDFYAYFCSLTEAINSYLKCIRQYPSLHNQLEMNCENPEERINNLITYILFQCSLVRHVSTRTSAAATRRLSSAAASRSMNQSSSSSSNQSNCNWWFVSWQTLCESLLSVFNLLVDHQLLERLCQRPNYSNLVSHLVDDVYKLIARHFFRYGDEFVINTPVISANVNIDYFNKSTGLKACTSDMLFNTVTFETMLKLRFIIVNPSFDRDSSSSSNNGGGGRSGGGGGELDSNEATSLKTSFSVSSHTHRFLQLFGNSFRAKLPFHTRDLIEKIYIGLCRLPVLDRFMRVPDVLWRTPGFRLDYGQLLKTDTSTLPPLEYLRDPSVLKEHLKHVQAVGWTTRNQFEYEYVNMLTLLHNLSDDYYLPMSSSGRSEVQVLLHSNFIHIFFIFTVSFILKLN